MYTLHLGLQFRSTVLYKYCCCIELPVLVYSNPFTVKYCSDDQLARKKQSPRNLPTSVRLVVVIPYAVCVGTYLSIHC